MEIMMSARYLMRLNAGAAWHEMYDYSFHRNKGSPESCMPTASSQKMTKLR